MCFFPKQTILPRRSATSRSPSIHRDGPGSALQRALVALAHLENPRMRAVIRPRVSPETYDHDEILIVSIEVFGGWTMSPSPFKRDQQ